MIGAALLALLMPVAVQDGPEAIDGIVRDSRGAAVPGAPVMLHRMSDAGGGLLATDTTDAEGRFRLVLRDGRQGAIHFAAASVAGGLFVGPVLAAEAAIPDPYAIRVRADVAPGSIVLEDGSVLGPDAFGPADADRPAIPPPPVDHPGAAALALLGVSAILVGLAMVARDRGRAQARRRALAELAELRAPGEVGSTEARRDELRERLHALRPR